MIDFHTTMMGKKFYEGTAPRIARALEKISGELERVNDNNNSILPGLTDEVLKGDKGKWSRVKNKIEKVNEEEKSKLKMGIQDEDIHRGWIEALGFVLRLISIEEKKR